MICASNPKVKIGKPFISWRNGSREEIQTADGLKSQSTAAIEASAVPQPNSAGTGLQGPDSVQKGLVKGLIAISDRPPDSYYNDEYTKSVNEFTSKCKDTCKEKW